ncbi:MAG: hypothetical protein ACREMR_12665 [Gemmatimonadales bacterium]
MPRATGDPRARWRAPASAALLLVPPLTLAWLGWRHRWTSEDAFILLRVVQNLLAGHGPVWNLGERVEVYTSPLWVGLLTLVASAVGSMRLEWIGVVLGLLFSAGGLLAAERGALRLWYARGCVGSAVPLGGLVIAALPPCWSYATSGLESGLVFAWLGTSFWGLAALIPALDNGRAGVSNVEPADATAPAHRAPIPLAVLIGLGPLVRPDLAVMSGGFLLLLLGGQRAAGGARPVRLIAAAAAIPVVYAIFRMGYFAALVPNTALAKEAFGVHWSQGWRYLVDFAGTYWLAVPCAALLTLLPSLVREVGGARHWTAPALVWLPLACGLLHAVYVVRLGGDFMHGRMLLPSLFTFVLPLSVVPVRRRHAWLVALIVVPWAMACALWLRVPYPGTIGTAGITDERGLHAAAVGRPHPVTIDHYAGVTYDGRALRSLAAERRALLLRDEIAPDRPFPPEMALAPRVAARIVAARPNIGLLGYAAGSSVHVVDRLGLGDALGSRLRVEQRGRPGHEKWLSDAWLVGRFADAAAPLPTGAPSDSAVAAARTALGCTPVKDLLDAIESPMTTTRFLRNIWLAWRAWGLKLAPDPARAVAELCAGP